MMFFKKKTFQVKQLAQLESRYPFYEKVLDGVYNFVYNDIYVHIKNILCFSSQ